MTAAIDLFNEGRYEEALPLFTRDTAQSVLGYAASLEYTSRFAESVEAFHDLFTRWPTEFTAVQYLASLYKAGEKSALDHWVPLMLERFTSDTVIYCGCEHYLKSGDLEKGMGLFWSRKHMVKDAWKQQLLKCPEWDGGPCDLLCITAEQAAGDILQQAAALHYLEGMNVIMYVEPRLVNLLSSSFPYIRFTGSDTEIRFASTSATARKCMLGDVQARYIKRAADWNRRRWIKRPDPILKRDGRINVGIAWSSPRGMAGNWKGIDLDRLSVILDDPDLRCINLQHGEARATDRLEDTGLDPRNMDDLAATIASCDAIVTTSNTVAHVAGSMGMPVELILPSRRTVYWYWGYEGGSPVYHDMVIHRLGDGGSIEDIRDDIVDAHGRI